MKSLIFLFFTLVINTILLGQDSTCLSFHKGNFKVFTKETGTTLIERTKEYQIEDNEFLGYKVLFDITWINDCTYELRIKKVIKGDRAIIGDGTIVLTTRIKDINNKSYIAETSSNVYTEKMLFTVEIVE